MQIFRGLDDFTPQWDSCILTLGVFDGFHRGHQELIKRTQKRSRRNQHARLLLSYEPHPDIVLGKRKEEQGAELFVYQEKLSIIQKFDLDAVVFLEFTPELAKMTAMRYLKEILLGKMRAVHLVIGYDQHFGRGRKGNYELLKKMSRRYPFHVERVPAITYRGTPVSTTRIRKLILTGDIEQANRLLGYSFFIQALVKRGSQRGRQLGFPTANLVIPPTKTVPFHGVYAGIAEWGNKKWKAMINAGPKPTFDSHEIEVEAHLIGFQGHLYGEVLRLSFHQRIRDQIRFSSPEGLSEQLTQDKSYVSKLKLKGFPSKE